MVGNNQGIPAEALEDVAFLSRSANRVAILAAFADGAASRRAVAEETGVTRTTLDRIVNELEERGWVRRTAEGDYVATPSGTHLMREFRPFLSSVAAIRQLDEAIAWLPIDALDVGLEHFRNATVREPARDDPVETVNFMADLIQHATEFRVLSHLVPPDKLGAVLHDAVVSGDLSVEGVVTDDAIAFLGDDPDRRSRWLDMLESGAEIHHHPGPIPCNLWIADDTVLIKESGPGPIDDSYGVPIVSDDETVIAWAHDLVDEYVAAGEAVTSTTFVEPTP